MKAIDERFGSGRRLVTLVGPPGAGKSRLAAEYLSRRSPTGARAHADLLAAERDVDVLRALSGALGTNQALSVPDGVPEERVFRALASALEGRHTLLWLDHCERMSSSMIGFVGHLLERTPGLRILAASWQPLSLELEAIVQVGPLDPSAALALYVERTRVADSPEEESEVKALLEALDHMPLTIELAASQAVRLSASELRHRIRRRLEFLETSRRNGIPRHRSLRVALDELWESLEEHEREVLRALAVTRGGATPETVARLVDESTGVNAIDALERLVARGLVRAEVDGGIPRCSMSDVLRLHVITASDLRRHRQRHASHHVERVESLVTGAVFHGDEVARRDFDRDVDNFLAAADAREDAPVESVRAVLALQRFTSFRGLLGLDRSHFDAAVDASKAQGDANLQARALVARAKWGKRSADLDGSCEDLQAALDLLGENGTDALTVEARALRAFHASWAGRPLAESVDAVAAAAEECGDDFVLAEIQRLAAAFRQMDGDLTRSAALNEEAAERYASLGYTPLERRARVNLGHVLQELGDLARAGATLEAVMEASHRASDHEVEHAAAVYLGLVRLDEGDLPAARTLLERASDGLLQSGSLTLAITALDGLGNVAGEEGAVAGGGVHMTEARRLLRKAIALATEGGFAYGAALCRKSLGQHELLTGSLSTARRNLEEVVEFSRRRGGERAWLDAILWHRVALLELGDRDELGGRDELEDRDELGDRDGLEDRDELATRPGPSLDASPVRTWVARLADVLGAQDPVSHPSLGELRRVAATPLAGNHAERLARRLIATVLRRHRLLGEGTLGPRLVVTRGGRWAQVDEGAPIRLGRSPVLRRILLALVESHRRSPGTPLTSRDLVEAAWPGEWIQDDAASNRVYDSVRRLRKQGLDAILLSSRDGYVLEPRCRVSFVSDEAAASGNRGRD